MADDEGRLLTLSDEDPLELRAMLTDRAAGNADRMRFIKGDGPLQLWPDGKGSSYSMTSILMGEGQQLGLIRLGWYGEPGISEPDAKWCAFLADAVSIGIEQRQSLRSLRERIKELTCMYGISQLLQDRRLSLEKLMQQIAELLPPAWQYPEIASARIKLNSDFYTTQDFRPSPYTQVAEINANGRTVGQVEIHYAEERPPLDEGPFMAEERSLLNMVARQLGLIVQEHEAEQEQERLQDQLLHADRLATIGQLAAGVAHELNEPLGSILGFAQLLQKSPNLTPQAVRDVERITKSALHSREVVNKLLIFARKVPFKRGLTDLNTIVEEGLCLLEARCAREKIILIRRLTPDLPRIEADALQLRQVIINLAVNSIQAMPSGGKLVVETDVEDRFLLLAVEDDGVGMDPKELEKIFLPFYTTKDPCQGTGLGLPVVHSIVTNHGGTVDLKSERGKGTRIEIRLPPFAVDRKGQ